MSTRKNTGKTPSWGIWSGIAGVVLAVVAGFAFYHSGQAPAEVDIVVYKSPTCGCCSKWIDHLEENGFTVESHNRNDMPQIKQAMGVPFDLQSCHTARIGDYIIEGHVPADVIARLLWEKPDVKGLAVPGMPMGSPGMEGPRKERYDIVAFGGDGDTSVYESR